jgi:cytochrome P450
VLTSAAQATKMQDGFMEMFQKPYPDPRPFYEELRQSAPVLRTPLGFWLVSTYDLGVAVLGDDRVWTTNPAASSAGGHNGFPDSFAQGIWYRSVMHSEGGQHARLRRLVMPLFTAPSIRRLKDQIQAAVDDEFDRLGTGEVDLFSGFSELLPTKIILNLLGLPADQLELFANVSTAMLALWEPTVTADVVERSDAIWREAAELILKEVAKRREQRRDDLLSHLVAASEEQERLSNDELVSMVLIIAVAGQETTASMFCSGMYHLLQNPSLLDFLRENPESMPLAVEELLRYESPARCSVHRYATEDTEVGGLKISKGEGLTVLIQSADHDPDAFENPLQLNLERSPNRHLGLGRGVHNCLGSALARLELNIAWQTLITRYPNVELATNDLSWRPNLMVRGVEKLLVRLNAGTMGKEDEHRG